MRRKPRPMPRFFDCPHCGAQVAAGAAVCRECGSDAATGWADEEVIEYQSIDLPSGYRSELPPEPAGFLPERRPRWWIAVAILLALWLLWLAVRG
jgi:hypothetical protein